MQPTATNLSQTLSFTEDAGPVALDDIVVTDTDPGEAVTATLTLNQPSAGTLTTSGAATYDAVTGVWTVTGTVGEVNAALAAVSVSLAADWEEGFSITTRIRDAANTGPADGTINVSGSGVNDAPVATTPASIDVPKDVTTAITGLSFSDVDAEPNSVTVTLSVPAGALASTSGGGVTVGGTASALTLTGTVADINSFIAASNVTYTPASGATGDVNLTVTIDDGGSNGTGGAQSDTEVVVLEVRGVNTAPTLDASHAPSLSTIGEDAAAPINGSTTGSTLVSALTGGAADADGGTPGIAVSGVSANGTLWFSVDNGATWTQAPAVSASNVLLLDGAARVFFQPDANFNGSVADAITFRAWDESAGIAGATFTVGATGGTSPFSTASDTASVTVSAVNDAPQISAPASLTLSTATGGGISGLSVSDVDAGGGSVVVTLSVPSGTLYAAAGSGLTVTGSGSGTMTVEGSLAAVNTFLGNNWARYVGPVDADVTLTVTVSDGGATGSGGAQSDTESILLHMASPPSEPEPPPPLTEVVEGGSITTRNYTGPGGVKLEEKQIRTDPPSPSGGPSGNQSFEVALDNLDRIMGNLGVGADVKVTSLVNPPSGLDLLPVLQLAFGARDEIANTKKVAEAVERLPGGSGPASVIDMIVQAAQELQAQNEAHMKIVGKTKPGEGPTVVNIDTTVLQAAQNIAATIALQNIHMAVLRGVMSIIGGAGPQIVFADGAAQRIVLGEDDDEIYGGGGDDVVGSEAGNDTLAGDEGRDTVFGGQGHDRLTGGTGDDHLHGNLGSDLLHGGEGADTMHGGQGDDAIAGGRHDDLVFGDLGDDTVSGELGEDFVSGGEGADFLHGNLGHDTLEGGAGRDLLHGGQGADSLNGGEGADTLCGDLGDDVLIGGAGADLFRVSAGGGADVIRDFDAAAGDRLHLDAGLAYSLRQVGADTIVDLGGGQSVVLQDVQLSTLSDGWLVAG